jgi:flagellar biogenesis protein FliO
MRTLRDGIFGLLLLLVISLAVAGRATAAPPTTAAVEGVFEKKPIHRTVTTAATASRGKGAAPASGLWDARKIPLALGAVILLILAMRIVGKKLMAGGAGIKTSGALSVVLRSSVSPRQQLVLVKVGRRLVLVGTGGNELTALCQIKDPDEVAELLGQIQAEKATSAASNFRAIFGKADSAYPTGDEPDEETNREVEPTDGKDLSGITDRIRRISEKFQKSQAQ